jgi:prevent-host-death family protein
MQQFVNVHEAKTRLSRLIKDAESGDEIIIQRDGKPVVRLLAIHEGVAARRPGAWAGKVTISPEFYEALSAEEIASFYGE